MTDLIPDPPVPDEPPRLRAAICHCCSRPTGQYVEANETRLMFCSGCENIQQPWRVSFDAENHPTITVRGRVNFNDETQHQGYIEHDPYFEADDDDDDDEDLPPRQLTNRTLCPHCGHDRFSVRYNAAGTYTVYGRLSDEHDDNTIWLDESDYDDVYHDGLIRINCSGCGHEMHEDQFDGIEWC